MSSYRCFRCGRELSAAESIDAGIGPICRARHSQELNANQKQSLENKTCHQGFHCYAPDHGLVTIGRFVNRFMALAEQTGLPREIVSEVMPLMRQYIDALGLKRKPVEVPDIAIPHFGDHQAIRDLNLPIEQGPFGPSVKLPVDYDEQYRWIKLSECQVCPFGLDCREPAKAVSAVWNILSIMRYQVEPWLHRNHDAGAWGWAWDTMLYQHLANSLEVLGLIDDGQDIQDIVAEQRKPKRQRGRKAHPAAIAMW